MISMGDLAGKTAAMSIVEDALPQREPTRKRARNLSGVVEGHLLTWADQLDLSTPNTSTPPETWPLQVTVASYRQPRLFGNGPVVSSWQLSKLGCKLTPSSAGEPKASSRIGP